MSTVRTAAQQQAELLAELSHLLRARPDLAPVYTSPPDLGRNSIQLAVTTEQGPAPLVAWADSLDVAALQVSRVGPKYVFLEAHLQFAGQGLRIIAPAGYVPTDIADGAEVLVEDLRTWAAA